MRELLLIRHAHSILATANMQDNERPLSKEGKLQAIILGKQLKKQKIIPQLIITSNALRAVTTAQIVAKNLRYKLTDIKESADLYLAEASEILKVINDLPSSKQHIIIVGHNPGLSQVSRILGEPTLGELATAAAYLLRWKTDDWATIIEEGVQPDKTSLFTPL